MQVKPFQPDLLRYLTRRGLTKKFEKQLTLFLMNPRHPSLHTEVMEPKRLRIFSFRIDQKYRVIFGFHDRESIEIIDINDHYQ